MRDGRRRMSVLAWWHKRWLRRHLQILRELGASVTDVEIARAGRILDWIGVARGMEHSERVKWLAIELACKQGLSLDIAETLANRAAGENLLALALAPVVAERPTDA